MSTVEPAGPPVKHLNVRQAAFIGAGAMVGAGIFSLLGAAGEVAGAAVWLSFPIAGAIPMLQRYSFGKFAVSTLANIDPHLLAFSGYPPLRDIVSAVALTFFAFLGFGIITFTAKDLANPQRELPRAMYLALGIATVIYVAVAIGVFGT